VLENHVSWMPERKELHRKILARAYALTDEVDRTLTVDGSGKVVAMRGNTAVGKTRTLGTSVAELGELIKRSPKSTLNPDNVKEMIMAEGLENGITVNHAQVHDEGSQLSYEMWAQLKKSTKSVVVDRRLGRASDIAEIITAAEATGRKMDLIDCEAPLISSLVGVLTRDPKGTDPIPPFGAIEHGFREVREGRMRVVELALNSDAVDRFELHANGPKGAKMLVAEKTPDGLRILDQQRFEHASEDPTEEIARTRALKITPELIDQLAGGYSGGYGEVVRESLQRYEGFSFEEAIARHAKG
jgi:hypothetical protein